MPARWLCVLLAAVPLAFQTAAGAQPPPVTPPAPTPATPVTSPDEAFGRLRAVVDAFGEIVDRIDRETGRKNTTPKLFVTFGWLSRWSGPWPNDFAPREEFIKLDQRVFAEAVDRQIPTAFAHIGKAESMDVPPPGPGEAPALNIDALRSLFEMNEYAFIRALSANQPLQAADVATAHLGVARLLAAHAGPPGAVGCMETRRAVVILMPLAARGSLDAKARASLAASIRPLHVDRTERIASEVDALARTLPSQWESIPKALFTEGRDAALAWNNLDDDTRLALSNYVGGKPAFPLPSADAMATEIRAAGERLKSWGPLPPMEIKQRAAQLTRAAKTPAESREERLISALVRAPQAAEEAALAVDALRVVLALEAFHDDCGGYPSKLEELIPKYLSSIPTDPGKPGSPLLYKRAATKLWGMNYQYILYSRGSDGVDDGASPMVDPTLSLSGISTEKGKDLILNGYHERK